VAHSAKPDQEKEMSRETKSRKIRYAVVGLGHIAQVAVLPAFRNTKNSELAAIVSGESEKRDKLGKKYRLDHLYSYEDYEQALSEVDAVYLAVPNHLHREYAVRAAEAGVHVLCEKPMAVTQAECPGDDRRRRAAPSEADDRISPSLRGREP
jgi:predicted dehydrogenase